MSTGPRAVILCAGVALLFGFGFVLFLGTQSLVGGGSEQEAASTPSPQFGTTTADMSPSGPPPVTCGEVTAGHPLDGLEPLVRGIHDAACRGDYAGLLPYMEDSFGGLDKHDVVAAWKQQDSRHDLAEPLDVART